jgi:hypothetical protein
VVADIIYGNAKQVMIYCNVERFSVACDRANSSLRKSENTRTFAERCRVGGS